MYKLIHTNCCDYRFINSSIAKKEDLLNDIQQPLSH